MITQTVWCRGVVEIQNKERDGWRVKFITNHITTHPGTRDAWHYGYMVVFER